MASVRTYHYAFLCNIVMIMLYNVVYCAKNQTKFNCDFEISDVIENKKWLTYDFVVGDCLVKRFINLNDDNNAKASNNDVRFFELLSKLDKYIGEKLAKLNHQIISLEKDDLSAMRVKNEIQLKSIRTTISRQQLNLNEALEMARMKVLLIETEIRDLMDKCLLKAIIDENNKQITYTQDCIIQFKELLTRVDYLYKELKSKVILFEVDSLIYNLHNNVSEETSLQ